MAIEYAKMILLKNESSPMMFFSAFFALFPIIYYDYIESDEIR